MIDKYEFANHLWDDILFVSDATTHFAVDADPITRVGKITVNSSTGSQRRRVDMESPTRFRCLFYFFDGNITGTAYLTTMYAASVTPTTHNTLGNEYIGVKFVNGLMYIVSYVGGIETTQQTGIKISTDRTYELEIVVTPRHSFSVSIDGVPVGSVSVLPRLINYLSITTLAIEASGSDIQLNVDYYQFMQER